jgi:hypothetical protein
VVLVTEVNDCYGKWFATSHGWLVVMTGDSLDKMLCEVEGLVGQLDQMTACHPIEHPPPVPPGRHQPGPWSSYW